MSGPNQANVPNAMILRRRSINEQAAHLRSCKGDCLHAIPPTLGEVVDYYPPKKQNCGLSTHFVVFLGLELAGGGSSLAAQAKSQYMCCVVCPVQWIKISVTTLTSIDHKKTSQA